MAITNSFKTAVANSNVIGIRIMMKDSLLFEPTFTDFEEMERLSRNIIGLYDSHDGEVFGVDKSAWNDEYMSKIMVQVVDNFSHERIDHLKEIIRYLYPVPVNQKTVSSNHDSSARHQSSDQPAKKPLSYQEQKRQDQCNGSYQGAKIAGGVIAGAVVGGTVAAAIASNVAVGAVVGGSVAGIAVAIATRGEE